MPQEPVDPSGRALTTGQLYRAVDSYLGFVQDVWGRSLRVAVNGWRDMMRIAEVAALAPTDPDRLFSSLMAEYGNYLSGLGTAIPVAAELAVARLREDASAVPAVSALGFAGGVPERVGAMRELAGGRPGASKPFALPARVIDASQGWAAYVVPCDAAAAALGPLGDFVAPFDLGGGRTLLVVSATDYRVCDLGSYREIGSAFSVTPTGDPTTPPGAVFVDFVVSGEFTSETARAIWGLEKIVRKDLDVSYGPGRARFGLADNRDALAISFPRFGNRHSDGVPMLLYSRLAGGDAQAATPLVSIVTRSGHGEGVQIGGSVSVQLGTANMGACVCQGRSEACLCQRLEQFGVKDRLPAANGWCEHMHVTLDAPQPLRLSRSGTAPGSHA